MLISDEELIARIADAYFEGDLSRAETHIKDLGVKSEDFDKAGSYAAIAKRYATLRLGEVTNGALLDLINRGINWSTLGTDIMRYRGSFRNSLLVIDVPGDHGYEETWYWTSGGIK